MQKRSQKNKQKSANSSKKSNRTVQLAAQKATSRSVPYGVSRSNAQSPLSFRVKHREFVASLDSNESYQYLLTLSNSSTFPWISNIAAFFDQYVFHRLTFVVHSALSASTSGTFGMAYDPNPSDTPPEDLSTLLQMTNKTDGQIWNPSFRLDIPAAALRRSPGPVRFTHPSADSDLALSTCGQLVISSVTATPLTAFANLYIEYDVELISPQPQSIAALLPNDCFPAITCQNTRGDGNMTIMTGNLLTGNQYDEIAAAVDSFLSPVEVGQSMSNSEETYSGGLAYYPLLMKFKEAGEYLVELKDLILPITGEYTSLFPALLNWTKGVSDVRLIYEQGNSGVAGNMEQRTVTPPGGGGAQWITTLLSFIVTVSDTVKPLWREAPDAVYESVERWPTLALGLWNALNGHASGSHGGDVTGYYQLGQTTPSLRVIRSPRRGSTTLRSISLSSHRERLAKQAGAATTTTTRNRVL